jgi:uncharacterized membrane protein YhaH (DUF805 family)
MEEMEIDTSRSWVAALVVSTLFTPLLMFAALSSPFGAGGSERGFQTLVFIAVCLAITALMAFRVLIARALDTGHPLQACLLGTTCFMGSLALIAYGLSTCV